MICIDILNILDFLVKIWNFKSRLKGKKSRSICAIARQTTSNKYQFTTSNICYNGNI